MTSRPWLSAPRKQFDCHVGPIGVSPSFSGPPPCCSTSTSLPSTTVVPLRLFANGSVCAMCSAYSGAAKLTTTISANRASAPSATLLRRRRRPARRQGLLPAMSRAVSPGARTTAPAGSGSEAKSAMTGRRLARRPSLHGRLGEEEVPLRAELEALHPRGREVEHLRVHERHPRRLVRRRLVDGRPLLVRGVLVLDPGRGRLVHLPLDALVAELRDVRARVRVGVERVAAEEDVEEIRRRRVVGEPVRPPDLDLVLGVLDVGV